MKKNPLLVLLGISFAFFAIFMVFVFFILQSFVEDNDSPLFSIKKGGKIGVIELEGVIMDSKKILTQLKKFEKDKSIKGVIVRIDSPGGAVGPSQEIYEALSHLRESKPVVASLASVAASGGYYVAVGAEKIVANAGTLTGSIGVIMNFVNLSKLYDWAKMNRYVIKSGKYKDIGSENREMTPEERSIIQEMIDNVHAQFIAAVAKGRKISLARVKEIATGRIFTGEQAHQLKLVDRLGGLETAVNTIKELAHMEGEPELIYPKPKRQSLAEALGSPFSKSLIQGILSGLGLPASLPTDAQIPHGLLFLAPGF